MNAQSLSDASAQITATTSVAMLDEKLNVINSNQDCSTMDESDLYKNLREIFANHTKGKLVKDILYTDKYPTVKIPLNDSVYGHGVFSMDFPRSEKSRRKSVSACPSH